MYSEATLSFQVKRKKAKVTEKEGDTCNSLRLTENLAERGGFEPPLRDPESRVLPLDDLSTGSFFNTALPPLRFSGGAGRGT